MGAFCSNPGLPPCRPASSHQKGLFPWFLTGDPRKEGTPGVKKRGSDTQVQRRVGVGGGTWAELSPFAQGRSGQVRPSSQLEAGHQLGNQESQVLVPAPPQTCWVSLGDQFPSLCFIYRKGGPGDLRRMLTCKILAIRSQDFHTGQEKAEGGRNWKAVQRGHTPALFLRTGSGRELFLQ